MEIESSLGHCRITFFDLVKRVYRRIGHHCVVKICLASFDELIIRIGREPRRRCMSGPYCVDSL